MLKNRERLLISLPPDLKDWTIDESLRAGTSAAKYIERLLEEKRSGARAERKNPAGGPRDNWF